jgi:hypothetical protein
MFISQCDIAHSTNIFTIENQIISHLRSFDFIDKVNIRTGGFNCIIFEIKYVSLYEIQN